MNIQITSRKFRAKNSLKDFIREELKTLEKYNDQIISVDVILSFTLLKDSIKTVEINLAVPRKIISVTTSSEEFEKSLTLSIAKLKKLLAKHKTKRLTRPKENENKR
ncbi:MAG: ribosome-associated translation inhibitor RaiA [Melioribacteraceae bacterium]